MGFNMNNRGWIPR